mgnify:CR=1 FL=1|jgi:hypothetical protein|tara:strand:- start:5357 stop:6088 length:732 start_codon:yes stop_codon:yes gene_type:complete
MANNKDIIFRTIDGIVRPIRSSSRPKHHYDVAKTFPTKCPGCKKDIYFYQNDHGSKVYFDQLGDPWPKHKCKLLQRYIGIEKNKKNKSKQLKNKALGKNAKVDVTSPQVSKTNSNDANKSLYESVDRYFDFSKSNLEKVIILKEGKGREILYIFRKSGLHVDYIRRNGIQVFFGNMLRLRPLDRDVLRKKHCDMPVYLKSEINGLLQLVTHICSDGQIKAYHFEAELGYKIEKTFDNVIFKID